MTILWAIFGLLFVFGGSIIYGMSIFIRRLFKHRERMLEKHNEELQLQIQLAQVRNTSVSGQHVPPPRGPLPKNASWEEQIQDPYETGYQQTSQQQ